MTTAAVHARVREILFHDWEGEYVRRGGMRKYAEAMIDKCFNGGFVAPCRGQHKLP
jgi:hypothetical protein